MDKKILKNIIRLLTGILIIWGIWWLLMCWRVDLGSLTPAAIRDYIRGFGGLAAAVYILAYALNTVSIFPPIAFLSLSAGLIFGKVWGAVFLMTGALIGTSTTFMISRYFGRGLVEKLLKGKLREFDNKLGGRGFMTVLFFRVVPLLPYEFLNYASGLTRIKFRDYFLATFLGLIPGVIIAAFFGGSLGEVRSLKDIFSPAFIVAAGLLMLVILAPVIYRFFARRGR